MTAQNAVLKPSPPTEVARSVPWRLSRLTNPLSLRLAGKRWNPVFAVVIHQGRKSGRQYETTVAARRVADGFVISLAFGPRVDWYRNVMAAGRATIRWRDSDYPVASPAVIDAATGRAAFHPIQRLLVRLAGIDGYIRLHDVAAVATAR